MFVLRPVAGGNAVVPAAVPRQRIVLAVHTVGFFTVVFFYQPVSFVIVVGVLSVTRIQVALTAVASFKLQRLHWGKIPTQQAVDIFVFYPFTTRRHRIGI